MRKGNECEPGEDDEWGESHEPPWEELFATASEVVRDTAAEFPPELKAEAERIPCLLEKWPGVGTEEDTLGLITAFENDRVSEQTGPIILFLGVIYEFCLENECDFAEEVRITYLHEFGHYLGWDEEDLEERGLL